MKPVKMSGRIPREAKSGYTQRELDLIRNRAYYIWEAKGKPRDSEFADWMEAEAALKREGLIR